MPSTELSSSRKLAETSSSLLRDYGLTIAAAIAIALGIRFFGIEAYRIPTATMKPTLEPGDTIFVAKWPYGIRLPFTNWKVIKGHAPHYGDVVIYAKSEEQGRESIKRVVAHAGDRVQLKGGRFLLNDHDPSRTDHPGAPCGREDLPDRSYGVCWEPPTPPDFGPTVVPADSLMLIGDFRTDPSTESHPVSIYSIVPLSALRGQAVWIWLSLDPPSGGSWFSRIRFERMLQRIQ